MDLKQTGRRSRPIPIVETRGLRATFLVKLILDKKVDVNVVDKAQGFSALTFALTNENVEVVKVLLDGGANPNLKSKEGTTMLEFAKKGKNAEIVKLLQDAGAK